MSKRGQNDRESQIFEQFMDRMLETIHVKRSETYERLHPLTDHDCYNTEVFECGELLLDIGRRWDVFRGYRVMQRFQPYDEFNAALKSLMPKALCHNGCISGNCRHSREKAVLSDYFGAEVIRHYLVALKTYRVPDKNSLSDRDRFRIQQFKEFCNELAVVFVELRLHRRIRCAKHFNDRKPKRNRWDPKCAVCKSIGRAFENAPLKQIAVDILLFQNERFDPCSEGNAACRLFCFYNLAGHWLKEIFAISGEFVMVGKEQMPGQLPKPLAKLLAGETDDEEIGYSCACFVLNTWMFESESLYTLWCHVSGEPVQKEHLGFGALRPDCVSVLDLL